MPPKEFDFFTEGMNPVYNWQLNWPAAVLVLPDPYTPKPSFKDRVNNYFNKYSSNKYNLANSVISGSADLAGNLINSNGLSSTAGNIMSGVGNIVGNIPGPIGWAGKGLALAGLAVNALWGHKFNDANVAAAESANRERNNWLFGDYSNTDALLAGSMANVLLGNVSKGFLGKEGPFSNAVTNKMNLINNDRMLANLRANNSELNAYNNYLTGMVRNAIAGDSMGNVNAAAYGGKLSTSNKINKFREGGFTSELDWSPESWLNLRVSKPDGTKYTLHDIDVLNSHVPEYLDIEESTKNNGTWLNMPDGSKWKGDPRSWVMMQSQAYKRNYSPQVWYTGQAEWPTQFDYGNGEVDTNKVIRAPYYNGQMWFSNNKLYGDTFANYIDSTQEGWRFDNDDESNINGINFLSAIPIDGNYRLLEQPKSGTHDYWKYMPYTFDDGSIRRLSDDEISNQTFKDLPNTNIRSDKQKVLTDDVVNWSLQLGDEGIYLYNVDDGPVINNGYIETPIIDEFISQPGFTKKVKFIEGNNGDFNINDPYKYSYNQYNLNNNMHYTASGGPLNMVSGPMTPFGNRYFANGGFTHGSLFNNGLIEVNNGGSHELNPNQGVQYGIDPYGTPNMVEEGETIVNDYVFSNRIKFPKKYRSEFGLGGKLKNKTFADISKKIAKESEERPNDPISQLSLKVMENKLANILEEVKAKQALDKMDPREVMAMLLLLAMMQQGGQPQMEEQLMMQDPYQQAMMMGLPMMAANGGGIYIKPSKRGTFTAEATKHGKSVLEFASQVLANPDNYSPSMVKKANFARNAAKWHACGGKLHSNGGNINLFYPGGDMLTPLDLAYINGEDSMDLLAMPEAQEYLASRTRRNLISPYNYAVNSSNVNVTPNYVPINGKSTWADFKDINGNPLYDVDKLQYTDAYLNPEFLQWAWDNYDNEYWSNANNRVNWEKGHPGVIPTNEDIFGSRGKAEGLGFDKKLSDLHWYLQYMYNNWLATKDTDAAKKSSEVTNSVDADVTPTDKTGYGKGIKYFIEDKDVNGTPFMKEIEYDADNFAKQYPGYSFLREGDEIVDDNAKMKYQQYIYGKKPDDDFDYTELPTYMRFAPPIALGIMSALDMAGITNLPDNSIVDSLLQQLSNNGYIPVRSHPINDPYVYTPENYNFFNANLNNLYAGRLRAAGNMFANNVGAYIAGSSAIDNALELARAEGMYNLKKQDLERQKEIGGLKTAIAQANQANSLDAQKANLAALADTFRRNAENLRHLAELRYKIKKDSDEAKSSNMSEFLQALADIGTENMNWNWRNWAIKHNVFGPMKTAPSRDVFYTRRPNELNG